MAENAKTSSVTRTELYLNGGAVLLGTIAVMVAGSGWVKSGLALGGMAILAIAASAMIFFSRRHD